MYGTWMRILLGGSKKTATGCFRLCSSFSVRHHKCISTYFALGWGAPASVSIHVLKKKTFLHFLPHPVYNFQMERSYRIKADATLTTEQIFICKVTKVSSSDKKTLDEFCNRLKYLTEKGCKVYELVEYPDILKLNSSEIDERIERLRSCGQSSISIPILKFAKPENSDVVIKNSLRRYRKKQNGYLNKIEEIKLTLRCGDGEILDILTRNSRLIGNRKRKFIVEKVKCLLDCGATLEDIKCNTNILNNKTLEVIETRARHLLNLGCDPLPMGVIGRTDDEYLAIVDRLAKQKVLQPTCQYLDSKEIIAKIPEYSNKKLYVVKPKVDFLLSKGYLGDDITSFPLILELSLGTIQSAITYLHQHYLGLVSLELCHKYGLAKRVISRQRSIRKLLANVLNCSSNELPQIPNDLNISANQEKAYHMNLEFLKSIGFSLSELKELPIVLAHNTEALKQCWEALQHDATLVSYLDLWRDDKKLQLQLLQYSIERNFNFSYTAFTEASEKQMLETSSFSLPAYESQEFDLSETEESRELKLNSTEGNGSFVEVESPTSDSLFVGNYFNVELKSDGDLDVNSEFNSNQEKGSYVKLKSNLTATPSVKHNKAKHDSAVKPDQRKQNGLNIDEGSRVKLVTNENRHLAQKKECKHSCDKEQRVGMQSVMTEVFSLSSCDSLTRDT